MVIVFVPVLYFFKSTVCNVNFHPVENAMHIIVDVYLPDLIQERAFKNPSLVY